MQETDKDRWSWSKSKRSSLWKENEMLRQNEKRMRSSGKIKKLKWIKLDSEKEI